MLYMYALAKHYNVALILILLSFLLPFADSHANPDDIAFSDRPLEEALVIPEWFKLSFLELRTDLDEAKAKGKKGLIIYFGQKLCPYCKAHMENNWGREDIVNYTRKYFDVIEIDVRGQNPVIDTDGKEYTEKQFAVLKKTNFTPSILFLDTNGKEILKLRGYRPPYQFKAALEYVADNHYKKENFRNYMARAELAESYGKAELNSHPLFSDPPFLLDRSRFPATQPLMVMFERKRCHACDVLHGGPLVRDEINERLKQLQFVQLDINATTPVLTPTGKKQSAAGWAKELNINYTPTIIFFDRSGKEIIRIESVVWFFRLRNVLEYVLSGAYKQFPTFQAWRSFLKNKAVHSNGNKP